MRWVVACLLAVVMAWLGYATSPYLALYRLGMAVEAGDVEEVAARVNVRAMRVSLSRQIAAEIAAAAPAGGLATADAQLAASAAVALADSFLDQYVTPDGLVRLLSQSPTEGVQGSVFGEGTVDWDDLDDFLAASSWRGFRNVYFDLPPGTAKGMRYRLQLRFGSGHWRAVGLEFPPEIRHRIAAEIIRRHGGARLVP